MKVLLALPGHLKTVPMGGYCAAALRRLGHEVIVFDCRPAGRDKVRGLLRRVLSVEDGESPVINARLRRLAQRERPDLFLTLFGFDVSPETIQVLRGLGIVTACWWLNDPFQLPRSLRQAVWYDSYFTNSRGCLATYAARGLTAVHFLPQAADVEVHRCHPLSPEEAAGYESDVCFAGDWSPLREEWVERLLDEFRVKVWGPWGRRLRADSPIRRVLTDGFFTPGEMVKAFSGAKLVLNLHGWFGRWSHGVNPRLFEAAGVGACQLVDRKDEIPDLYRVPEEVVCFDSFDECRALLQDYLVRDAERAAVGARAAARTLREHTYEARMQALLTLALGGGVPGQSGTAEARAAAAGAPRHA
jgi:spore maturation protein CgeB